MKSVQTINEANIEGMEIDKNLLEEAIAELVHAIKEKLIARGEMMATAESCTGGLVASSIVNEAGSSAVLAGGTVAYQNEVKEALLGVSHETLEQFGAVSEQTVREMSAGALEKFGCQWAVSTSGIAGPGGAEPGKPVGTVWMSISWKNGNNSVQNAFVTKVLPLPEIVNTRVTAGNGYYFRICFLDNFQADVLANFAMDKFDAALAEIPKVRADLGYPPLVTPLSQMVGNQAVTNVLIGERYKNISKEVKNYIKGEYGIAPAPIDPELSKKVLGDDMPVDCRIEDVKRTGEDFAAAKEALGDLCRSEEDIMSYICYPDQTLKFLENKKAEAEKEVVYTIEEM